MKYTQQRRKLIHFLVLGLFFGMVYVILEYFIRINTNDPQEFIPLVIRSLPAIIILSELAALFEIFAKEWFRKKPFYIVVASRTAFYFILISFILSIINGIWEFIAHDMTFWEGIIDYITDESYVANLVFLIITLVTVVSILEINSLHRKGELIDFILGRYHTPKEMNRMFCFIDLKGSTTIGEQLGHYKFGMFLRDYYAHITDAIVTTEAEIYQYVGDEIVLCWTYKKGIKNNNAIQCFFLMKDIIDNLKGKYIEEYGVVPEFKAGLHGGTVTVTWVGELKKEIVFIGDVLNTTARIQESCKKHQKDFIVSGELLSQFENLEEIKTTYLEETRLRGRKELIKLFSLERQVFPQQDL